jgi:hypothetical protein
MPILPALLRFPRTGQTENVGIQFVSLRHRPEARPFSSFGCSAVSACRAAVLARTSGLRHRHLLLLPFSDRPFFSDALYYGHLIQSLLRPNSRAFAKSRVRISIEDQMRLLQQNQTATRSCPLFHCLSKKFWINQGACDRFLGRTRRSGHTRQGNRSLPSRHHGRQREQVAEHEV